MLWLPLRYWTTKIIRLRGGATAMVTGAFVSMAYMSFLLLVVFARDLSWLGLAIAGLFTKWYGPESSLLVLAIAALLMVLEWCLPDVRRW